MAPGNSFSFKQFQVRQPRAGMKVTSDACLFGAWVPIQSATRILDIGTGSGLLALMAAQRTQGQIDAVELDSRALLDAAFNFAASPWHDRINLIAEDICRYSTQQGRHQYDAIICNPPFFNNSLKCPDQRRNRARHTDSLSYPALLKAISACLSPDGQAHLLLPSLALPDIQQELKQVNLDLLQLLEVRPLPNKPVHRVFVSIGKGRACHSGELCLMETPTQYSKEASELLRPYYLKL